MTETNHDWNMTAVYLLIVIMGFGTNPIAGMWLIYLIMLVFTAYMLTTDVRSVLSSMRSGVSR